MDAVFEAVNGRVPVVVGASHAQIETVIALSRPGNLQAKNAALFIA